MPKKKHSIEEIVGKLRQVDVMTSQGRVVGRAICTIGVAEVTYHRWHNEFGGLKFDQVRGPKKLGLECSRLRMAVPDVTLDKLVHTEALSGK